MLGKMLKLVKVKRRKILLLSLRLMMENLR